MHTQNNSSLWVAIIIGGALIVAALIVALGPMLWTDHHYVSTKPVPAGCTIQQGPAITTVHCPSWVDY